MLGIGRSVRVGETSSRYLMGNKGTKQYGQNPFESPRGLDHPECNGVRHRNKVEISTDTKSR